MAILISPGDRLFLDTSYVVALAAPNDELHEQAMQVRDVVRRNRVKLVTTTAVLMEIGNALSHPRFRTGVVRLLTSFAQDRRVTIVPLDDELYEESLDLFSSRVDQHWGLIDCASFVVMKDHGLLKALTADHHFEQAGFEILLKHAD
jgi:uncharacterized protein